MHLIPHEAVAPHGMYRTVLETVMNAKIGTGTWQQRSQKLLEVLRDVNGLPRDSIVEDALTQWRTQEGAKKWFLNDSVWEVAIYVLGRLNRERREAHFKSERDATEKAKKKMPVDEDLKDNAAHLLKGYLLQREAWQGKEELADEDLLEAFASIVDSEANVVRTHQFYETLWDCNCWMPVWDPEEQCYRIHVLPWQHHDLSWIAHNHAERISKFGSSVSAGIKLTKREAGRLLEVWYARLRQVDEYKVSFPPRVFRTILTVWGKMTLLDAGCDPYQVAVSEHSGGSPLLEKFLSGLPSNEVEGEFSNSEDEGKTMPKRRKTSG
eukprot:1262015-Amphidinium_carterae.1